MGGGWEGMGGCVHEHDGNEVHSAGIGGGEEGARWGGQEEEEVEERHSHGLDSLHRLLLHYQGNQSWEGGGSCRL